MKTRQGPVSEDRRESGPVGGRRRGRPPWTLRPPSLGLPPSETPDSLRDLSGEK